MYVQDRLTQNASELWKWLQGGAHLYVCGDARRMAADVDSTLRSIVATEGNLSEQEAAQYLTRLNKDKRYVRDVY